MKLQEGEITKFNKKEDSVLMIKTILGSDYGVHDRTTKSLYVVRARETIK